MLKRIWLFLFITVLLVSFSACGKTQAPQAAQPAEELVTDAITLMENDSVTVRVLKIEPEAEAGYTVSIMVWNRTDINFAFIFDDFAVNDLLYGEVFQFVVNAGEKQLKRITLDPQRMEALGLSKVTKIDFRFYAMDTDFIYDSIFFEENLAFFPLGEAAYKTHQRTPAQTDVVWFDNEYCSVTYVESFINETDFLVSLYVTNKTDKKLTLDVTELLINGTAIHDASLLHVPAGKQRYDTLFLSLVGMDSEVTIESLAAEVAIYDAANYTDGPLSTVSVSYE